MLEKVNSLIREAEDFKTQSIEELEKFRIKLLGKKGALTSLFAEFKNVAKEDKKQFGQKINELIERML